MKKTIQDRIIEYLKQHPEGVDDDELARALNLKQRQQANSRCRQLEAMGAVERRKVRGKIHNFLIDPSKAERPTIQPVAADEQPWHWEQNVQDVVVDYLIEQGYTILQAADTASRERGKDIVAELGGHQLWITVKGYPVGTLRTRPTTQAGLWFKQALFDIIEYRQEDPNVDLAMALPDFPRYRGMAEKVAWIQPAARFTYIWVQEGGAVVIHSCE